jgi:16S rRNA C967 or C1407 C5-methylase (RsmB/RsmF family)
MDPWRLSLGVIALVVASWMSPATAQMLDFGKYPDLKGQWLRARAPMPNPGQGPFDPSKRGGPAQEAPLTFRATLDLAIANNLDLAAARRGYKEINLRAMQLLAPGGTLVTSSCSYNLDEGGFAGLIADAAADAGRDFVVVARRGQAADHPVRMAFPEGRYLKCFVLRDAPGTA